MKLHTRGIESVENMQRDMIVNKR